MLSFANRPQRLYNFRMRKKIFIGFDKAKSNSSLRFVTKNAFLHRFADSDDLEFTYNLDEDVKDALFFSAEDFLAYLSVINSRGDIKTSVICCNDITDFSIVGKGDERHLVLAQTAFNLYPRADRLLVFAKSQSLFLKKMGISKEPLVIQPFPTFHNDDMPNSERNAFRSYYHIPKSKPIIASFGTYGNRMQFELFESLARLNPDKEFIFFGHSGREFVNKKLLEKFTDNDTDNIRYENYLPEELYHSGLMEINGVIFLQGVLASPIILLDLILHHIPLIAYKPLTLQDLINEHNTIIPKDFPSLYQAVRDIAFKNKSEEAISSLKSWTGSSKLE